MMAKRAGKLKLGAREQWLAVSAVVFLILLAADLLVVRPTLRNLDEIDREIVTLEHKLQVNSKALAMRDDVKREWDIHSDRLKPPGSDAITGQILLSVVEELAQKNSVNLKRTNLRDPRSLEFLKEFAVDVQVETKLTDLVYFLYNLQNQTDLLRVNRLDLSAQGGGGGKKSADAIDLRGTLVISRVITI